MGQSKPRPMLQQPNDLSVRLIPLTKGKVAVVDAADYERLSQWVWSASLCNGLWYAQRSVCLGTVGGKKKYTSIFMHRFILDAPKGMKVDHRDGDGLNNRRNTNLRLSTHGQNLCNHGPNKTNTSGFKGVHWDKVKEKWVAQIQVDGHMKYLGLFVNKSDAALAYKEAAAKYHGEFARTEPFKKGAAA
jgi:hypothetical protein